jgi:hypothetical protein
MFGPRMWLRVGLVSAISAPICTLARSPRTHWQAVI